MTATALLVSLLLTGADDLAATKLNGLSVKVPSAWKKTAPDKDSVKYESPQSDAAFELSVYPVSPRREGKVCVDQLVKALGAEGWVPITVGGAPAAQKSTTEAVEPEGEGEKKQPVEVQTDMVVGCDGKTKWVLTMTQHTKNKARYDAIALKVVNSIAYPK